MKIQDIDNEMVAIMTLLGFEDKPKAVLAATLRADHFSEPRCVSMYTRIMAMSRSRHEMPSYDVMQHDTLLPAEARELLDSTTYPPAKTAGDAEQVLFALEQMRQSRVVYNGIAEASALLNEDAIDITDAFSILENTLRDARTDQSDETLSMGLGGNFLEAVAEMLNRKEPNTVPTGFHEFDNSCGGLPRGGLTTFAASSGGGKSCMAVQVAINAVHLAGLSAAIVTLEMNKEQTTGRISSNLSRIDYTPINTATLNEMQKTRIDKATAAWMQECIDDDKKLEVFHRSSVTFTEIALEMRAMDFDLVIVDYIGLLNRDDDANKNSNDAAILGEIAKEAKQAATATNTAWVMLAQLNEQGDVKYSKAIKEHSDCMLTWVYGDAEKESHIIEINIAKSRHGKSFKFPLRESFKTQRLENPGKPDNNNDVAIKKGKKKKAGRHPTAKPMFGDMEDDDDDL
jgi:replicative DNA helicase